MGEFLGTLAAGLAAAVSMCVLIGLVVRFGLLPYLREHLIVPVKDTHKQVTENHHTNERPTVLDRIDDVSNQVQENTAETRAARGETRALARMFDGHLEWSQNEVDALWNALREQRDRGER